MKMPTHNPKTSAGKELEYKLTPQEAAAVDRFKKGQAEQAPRLKRRELENA